MRTSSESDSGFNTDRAVVSVRASVACLVEHPGSVIPVSRGAVSRQSTALAASPRGLTATAANNSGRSGRFDTSPTYRPVISLSVKGPADLHAPGAVRASSSVPAPGITAHLSSFSVPNAQPGDGGEGRGQRTLYLAFRHGALQ